MLIEIYQYWTVAGFVFLFVELLTLKTMPLVLAGASLFAAVIAFKLPDEYIVLIFAFLFFIPIIYFALKPYIKNKIKDKKSKGADNELK